jgi:pantoate--beta-alanine ligase
MEIVNTISDMKALRRRVSESVGFVPTMGYLHEGHLSLVRQARNENSTAVVSIFVNPTQFGPAEDLNKYPRDLDRDISLLQHVETDILFLPKGEEIYPKEFDSWVEVLGITDRLEGMIRPGHFRGVTTVVSKLFNIVEPTCAYFGQKDAQQAKAIEKMVRDLNINVKITVGPTVRETDGLAMSSRNSYLNQQERQAATILYKTLQLSEALWQAGETNAEVIKNKMIALIDQEPLAVIDYVSIADDRTLHEFTEIAGPALVSLAVRIGHTRLIDNLMLK